MTAKPDELLCCGGECGNHGLTRDCGCCALCGCCGVCTEDDDCEYCE